MKKTNLLLIFLLFQLASFCQFNQVNIPSFRAKPVLPASTADWASTPGALIMIAQKVPQANIGQFKLMVSIKQNDNKVCGNTFAATGFVDSFGTKTYQAGELTGIMGNCDPLKPGGYTICAQFVNADNNAISKEVCANFRVEGGTPQTGGTDYTQPQNLMPIDGKMFDEKEAKAPVTFRWTPVLPKPQGNVTYKVRVFEIRKNQSAAEAMKTESPLFEKEAVNQTQLCCLNINIGSSSIASDSKYGWYVEAANEDGKVLGVSWVTVFGLISNCNYNFKLSVTSVECIGNQNGLNNYKVCINSYFQSSILSLTYLNGGSGISATHPSYLPAYPVSAITPSLTAQGSGAGTNNSYCFNVAVPVGQTSIIIGLQGDDKNPSPIITCQPSGDTLINLPICNQTDCCLDSKWGEIIHIKKDGTKEVLPKCGSKLGELECNKPFELQAYYLCNQSCNSLAQLTYQVYDNLNNPVGLPQIAPSSAAVTITTPASSGNYYINITANCGGKVCNVCKYYFTVNCSIDCCKGSHWGEIHWQGGQMQCGNKLSSASVTSIQTYKCNEVKQIKSEFYCNAQNCKADIEYVIADGSTNAIVWSSGTTTSGSTQNITMPSTSGYYCLKVYGKCGGVVCDSCKVCFKVSCPASDCCKGSKWGDQLYYKGDALISFPTATSGGNIGEFKCGDNLKTNICYNCAPNCGPAQIKYDIYIAYSLVLISSVTKPACSLENVPLPAIAGNYQLLITPICNGKECQGKDYMFTVTCPPADCCKGSYWDKIAWKGFPKLSCNTNINTPIPVNTVEIVNYKFTCAQGCKGMIRYDIKNSFGTVFSSVTAVSGVDQKITLPSSSGQYCLVAFGLCDGKICDSCSICFTTTCATCDDVIIKVNKTIITPATNYLSISGSINTTPKLVTKVTAQLVSFSADNFPVSPAYPPIPNFEFALQPLGMSTINGANILIPFSLTGTRSNIGISNISIPSTVIPFDLKVDNCNNKRIRHFRIKFTILFTDGTYCEQEILKNF